MKTHANRDQNQVWHCYFSIQKADQTEAWKLSLHEEAFSKPANSQYSSNDSSLNKANAILLS